MLAELERRRPTLFEAPSGEPTLDEVISGVWEELTAHQAAACPICGGTLKPEYSAHARPIGGRCTDCATTLR
jgi:hypothetical protein